MSSPFTVDTGVFNGFAASMRGHAEALDSIVASLTAAHVSRGSFGYLPASDDLQQAYEEHVTSCIDGLTGTAETFGDVADATDATRANYDGAEDDAIASFQVGG